MALRKQIQRLKQQDKYDLFTALRGPDQDDSQAAADAKALTTAVFRYFVFTDPDNISGNVHTPAEAKVFYEGLGKTQQKRLATYFTLSGGHYARHVLSALEALKHVSAEGRRYAEWFRATVL